VKRFSQLLRIVDPRQSEILSTWSTTHDVSVIIVFRFCILLALIVKSANNRICCQGLLCSLLCYSQFRRLSLHLSFDSCLTLLFLYQHSYLSFLLPCVLHCVFHYTSLYFPFFLLSSSLLPFKDPFSISLLSLCSFLYCFALFIICSHSMQSKIILTMLSILNPNVDV